MFYLISLALVVWLLGMLPKKYGLQSNNYKNYLLIAGGLVWLIAALRDPLCGSMDTYRYTIAFDTIGRYDSFKKYYDLYLSDQEFIFSESGFHYFVWFLTRIFSDSQMIIVASSLVTTVAVCQFLRNNVEDVPTGLLIYVCLGLLTFNMNGMRQALAMSICLYSYEFAKKRKMILFVLSVLLAMQFHKTAICFIPVYFLPTLKEGKANTFLYICGMIIFLFGVDWFIESFNAFTGEDYELDAQATGGGFTVILLYAFAFGMSLLMHDSLDNRQIRISFFCVTTGFAAYIARFFSNEIMERISYYYFYFLLLLLPQLFGQLEEREQKIVKIGFSVFAILLFAYRIQAGNFSGFTLFFL